MKHKDYKTINLWLRDLREKRYVGWIYSSDFAERTKPAVYYLGLNGIRFLKTLDTYSIEELRKRYRESSRSQTYIDRCSLLADCCLTLEHRPSDDKGTHYYYETEADYLGASYYHFLAGSELIHPQLCFSLEQHDEYANKDVTLASYLLEVFDANLPRYRIKKRLANYVQYLDEEVSVWISETDTEKPPIILLVCPRTSDLIYAKRRTRGLIANTWERYDYEGRANVRICFTTVGRLKERGIIAQDVWEEA